MGLTNNGKVFISLPDKESQNAAKNCLEQENYNIETESKPTGLFPKITIHDLDHELYTSDNKEKLLTDIKNKNPEIKQLIEQGKTFNIIFIKEIHNKRTSQLSSQAVVKVDPSVLSALHKLQAAKGSSAAVYIGNRACRVSDRVHILQCYACQAYGHKKNSVYCPYKGTSTLACMYCSLNHPSRDCPNKRNLNLHKCVNCTRFNQESQNTCHSTTDYSKCPLYQKQIDSIIKKTLGMSDLSKNDFAKHVFVT